MKIGIYPGSFDPLTLGHLDIIKRSLSLCDQLIVAIGINPQKHSLFSEDERLYLFNKAISETLYSGTAKVKVEAFQGLLTSFVRQKNASFIIRGVRSAADCEYELNLAHINKSLDSTIETIFLPANPSLSIISSSMVKEIAKFGGDVSQFVPSSVHEAIQEKFKK